MKPGDAVIALKHIRSNNPSSPELGRVIPKGYIDIIITVNDKIGGIGLQGDVDPAGFFWEKKNFRILATENELDAVLTELELTLVN